MQKNWWQDVLTLHFTMSSIEEFDDVDFEFDWNEDDWGKV